MTTHDLAEAQKALLDDGETRCHVNSLRFAHPTVENYEQGVGAIVELWCESASKLSQGSCARRVIERLIDAFPDWKWCAVFSAGGNDATVHGWICERVDYLINGEKAIDYRNMTRGLTKAIAGKRERKRRARA